MDTGICDARTRYAPGAVPCVGTMCSECEGMGGEPCGEACPDCRGTGRRRDLSPLRIAVSETTASLTEPVRFAWFMWREYGWDLGRPLSALSMTWRDHRGNRGALWRYARTHVWGVR